METGLSQINSLVKGIEAFVGGEAQSMEIGEVERRLLALVMEVGLEALKLFVSLKGTGFQVDEIVDDDGRRVPYVRDRGCDYASIFGRVRICRAYYHSPGTAGTFPLDGELNLPKRSCSYLVQEFVSKLAVNMSYEKAVELFGSFFPLDLPIRSVESFLGDLSDDVADFYETQSGPETAAGAEITVATIDRKGVVIKKSEPHGPDNDAVPSNPDKPGKKKMAVVVSAYNTQRHIRTPNDILKEMSEESDAKDKPKPENKHLWGSLTEGPEKTVARLQKATTRRLPKGNELVCILDGERSLWALIYQYFPTAFFVLDIFHVMQYLAKAAHCFHPENSPEARKFVTERLQMLLLGKAGKLIGGLKQMQTKHKLSDGKAYDLGQVVGYLERNRRHMRYEICLKFGYPIGSGVIEGGCRNLINDRLELTGMRWSPNGAESVIRLRAVHINKDWDSFWKFRRKSERRRLYGDRYSEAPEIRDQELRPAA